LQVWRVSTIFDENSILTELPSFLRDEVVAGAYGSLATDVPFMQDMPASMVSMLVMALKFETVLPTQCIVRKGTLGSNMYIVMGGLVQLFYGEYEHENFELSDKNIGALEGAMRERPGVAEAPFTRNPEADKGFKISRGDFFCEYTVLFAVPPQHIYTAVAIERTMVLSFPKEMYLKTIDVFPQLRDQILKHTKLANPMVAKLAQHFKNNDALKMNIAVGNMQAISARSAMRYRSLSAEEIREDNEVQWNPIKKSLDAVAQATIHGLERWLDQRQSLLPDDYLDDDDESSVDQHHHHEDSDPHHEMSRPPLPHRRGAASTGAPAAAGNRRRRRKIKRASTLITELSLADAGGSHGALQARLDKLEDVVGKIAEGQTRLEHLLEKIHVIATEEDLR
jgi:CRP-like cAMP-binding protein